MSSLKCRCAAFVLLALTSWGVLLPSGASAQQPAAGRARLVPPATQTAGAARQAAARRPILIKPFDVDREFGDRDVFEITLGGPGRIRIEAVWRGTAASLAIILNGPGQTGFYARRDGRSPLSVEFEVTPALFERGSAWTVSVVNFGGGSATGRVSVDYPVPAPAVATLMPALRDALRASLAETAPPAVPHRSILPDGRVQIKYPDGRTVIHEPGCGSTTIFPDGKVQKVTCHQVQPATLPAAPSEPAVRAFLESHRDQLLRHIAALVDDRQAELDLYLAYEGKNAKGLFDQIRMRTALINTLLLP